MVIQRGCMISLDGLDGSGKSTQCLLLAEHFRALGKTTCLCQDPGSTELGRALRQILLHHPDELCRMSEATLFMAARAQMISEVILPAMERNETVVCDRFILATIAYQGYGSGLDIEGLREATRFAAGGLLPDLSIVLDLPVTTARARLGTHPDRLERRSLEFHQKVRNGFLEEAKRDGDRISVIDADTSPERVFTSVIQAISDWEARRAMV